MIPIRSRFSLFTFSKPRASGDDPRWVNGGLLDEM